MTFARVPVNEVRSLSGKVVPGVFSAVQQSAHKLTRYLLMITEAMSYITIPATIGLALVAANNAPLCKLICPRCQEDGLGTNATNELAGVHGSVRVIRA